MKDLYAGLEFSLAVHHILDVESAELAKKLEKEDYYEAIGNRIVEVSPKVKKLEQQLQRYRDALEEPNPEIRHAKIISAIEAHDKQVSECVEGQPQDHKAAGPRKL